MAELKRRSGAISKGMKLPVTVEEVINDVLVVTLEVGTRDFKGVLLDTKKRNLPHGICMPFSANGDGGHDKDNIKSEHGAPEVEVAATTFRHSYNKPSNISQSSGINSRPINIFQRTFKDKSVRNIRLRPRSTLCSKCKAVCHETDKGAMPVTQVVKQPNQKNPVQLPQTQRPTLRDNLRKRQYLQRQDVTIKDAANDKTSSVNTRASPFIKISIGEGTVLKIPPRLHDEVDGVDSNTSQTEDNAATNAESIDEPEKIKRAKKSLRKSRDRERGKSADLQENEVCSISSTSSVVTAATHHRKHKRKHKHRHSSGNSDKDKNAPAEKVDENGESQNLLSQTEVISQRPRLLYTWRQNKGLSPRRDNTSNTLESFNTVTELSPKQHLSPKPNMSPKRRVFTVPQKQTVRSKSTELIAKKEYKLRSRERLSTESAEQLVNEPNNSGSENDKYSLISSASEAEIESSKSGDEYSSTGINEEEDCEDITQVPSSEESNVDAVFCSLMMKIHTHDVPKCIGTDGRTIHVGDIVWGKIKGFPWWPGRVLSISVSERENGTVIRKLAHVSWFGSSTMSHIQCSDLYPFLEDFKLRYNRKKRGPYKVAIKQATIAAQSITNTHHIDFSEFDL